MVWKDTSSRKSATNRTSQSDSTLDFLVVRILGELCILLLVKVCYGTQRVVLQNIRLSEKSEVELVWMMAEETGKHKQHNSQVYSGQESRASTLRAIGVVARREATTMSLLQEISTVSTSILHMSQAAPIDYFSDTDEIQHR